MGWIVVTIIAALLLLGITQQIRSGRSTAKVRRKRRAKRGVQRSSPASAPAHEEQRATPPPIMWFGPDQSLRIAGHRLDGPCVYASEGRPGRERRRATDPSEILLELPVHDEAEPIKPFPSRPWYARLSPGQRLTYLSWIASGRPELPEDKGMVLLFFYGLERRLLIDREDRAWVIQEVVRLRGLAQGATGAGTGVGRTFLRTSMRFLWFEVARTPMSFSRDSFDVLVDLTTDWSTDLLVAPLAWLAAREQPLTSDLARAIASCDAAAQRHRVAEQEREAFQTLFSKRFTERYGPDGMTLQVSKREAWHVMRPANASLHDMRCRVSNPLGMRRQFRELTTIWNGCIDDLRPLARKRGESRDQALTVTAWHALPEELQEEIDHPLTEAIAQLIERTDHGDSNDGGFVVLPAGRMAALLDMAPRAKLTTAQSRLLAEALDAAGYGIVPDARLTAVRYGWEDSVAIVPGLGSDDVDPERYAAAACVLRLGMFIASADGDADDVECRVLIDHVESIFGVTTAEHERLLALGMLLRKHQSTAGELRTLISAIPTGARRSVGRMLVAVAAATDDIDDPEREALRMAFSMLKLPGVLLDETLREIAPEPDSPHDDEVMVLPAIPGEPGEPIETEAVHTSEEPAARTLRLNREAISVIMAETEAVSAMLAEAMALCEEADDDTDDPEPSELPEPASGLPGPAGRLAPLYAELIRHSRWRRAEAETLARSHGFMLNAAIEAINDWSFDRFGVPLIEDEGETLLVDHELLRENDQNDA